ncbi:TPA_asm: cell surface protein [Listeria monocytogenes]|nr:cell surface protein [Listeria monocytogenes]
MRKLVLLLVCLMTLLYIFPANGLEANAASTSWLETELDGNEAFIVATEKALSKSRENITLSDLETIKNLFTMDSPDSIPDKISDYKNLTNLTAIFGTISEVPASLGELKKLTNLNLNQNNIQEFPMVIFELPALASLAINTGTITEVPTQITTLSSHLVQFDISFNHLISLPDTIFSTKWTANSNGKLNILVVGNQITSAVPANYIDESRSQGNMLEYYKQQDQLIYTGGTITVPLNTNLNQITPDKTKLGLQSGTALFPQHQFIYYDDGTSNNVLTNGVASHIGNGYITIKSSLSTNTNPFAKVRVPITVTAPEKGADITVQYLSDTGDTLATPDTLTGNVGDSYSTSAKTITDYTLKSTPSNATGTFTSQAQTVNYVYTKNKVAAAPVTVHYVDTNGKDIAATETLTGNVGDSYESTAKIIDDYTLKSTPSNATGTFTSQDQTVNYVYTKNKVAAAPVTVHYVDTNGKDIAVTETLTGNVGDSYTISPKSINGYVLKEMPSKTSGKFSQDAQQITFIYTKQVIPSPNPITVIEQSAKTNHTTSMKQTERKKDVLPKTGDHDNSIYLLLGCLLIGSGLILNKRSHTK